VVVNVAALPPPPDAAPPVPDASPDTTPPPPDTTPDTTPPPPPVETDVTTSGTPIASVMNPTGGGNHDIGVIRDGVFPPVGSQNSFQQYDTYNGTTRTSEWIGYQFSSQHSFVKVVFQEGKHFWDGGWFTNMRVQVRQGGAWIDVAGATVSPTYPGNNWVSYETFTFTFPAVSGDGLRIFGAPGGGVSFISVGEIRVFSASASPPANRAPTASAGMNLSVTSGAPVMLDGSGSSDPDGDPLTYQWTQNAGPTVTLSSTTASRPTFTAPSVSSMSSLVFTLVVSDGRGASSSPAMVTVTVTPPNRPPVANAGPDQEVAPAALVTLDGTGSSDPDGNPLTYQWVQAAGPAVTLSSAAAGRPTFTAPNVTTATDLVFSLVVRDAALSSPADTVNVRVAPVNRPPVASAGADQAVLSASLVTLDGSGSSDPDGEAITYEWWQIAGPAVLLSNPAAQRPTFTAPAVAAATDLIFGLVVRDAALTSPISTVTVTVNHGNTAPIASAGPNQSVLLGVLVTLDGSGSSDPDGDPITYQWTQIGGPVVALSNPGAMRPTFLAPLVLVGTDITFSLVVRDASLSSPAATVTVTVNRNNTAPVASAGADQTVIASSLVTLDGSGSADPDGDPLTYDWSQIGGPVVVLSSTTAMRPTFTAPVVTGTTNLTFNLVVRDGALDSPAATVIVTVNRLNRAPVASAGANQSATSGALVTLDGSGSFDPDGDPITYSWVQAGGPAVALSSATAMRPTFTAPTVTASTNLVFSLVVRDATLASAPATVTVTVNPAATPETDVTTSGTPIAFIMSPTGGGNRNLAVVRDGVFPAVSSQNSAEQYDTYNGTTRATDWIGHSFSTQRSFTRLVFQEGKHFWDGGWFVPSSIRIQVRQGGAWVDVPGVSLSPSYPGNNWVNYQTFTFTFPAVTGDGLRIFGTPGGSATFISVGELRVFAR
jgi:hypothetical protein